MEIEPGDTVDDLLLSNVDRPRRRQPGLERTERCWRDEGRNDVVPAVVDQPLDHEPTFRNEELVAPQPLRITDVLITLESGIVFAVDLLDQSLSRVIERRLRWLSITC